MGDFWILMTARAPCLGPIWLSLRISSNETTLIPLQICSSDLFYASLLSSLGLHVTLILTNCDVPERILPRTSQALNLWEEWKLFEYT